MINISIGNKDYKVQVAITLDDQEKGLLGITNLPENEGMLFYFEPPLEVAMWMKGTLIPLDIVFINKDEEVISVVLGEPESEELLYEQDVAYVLEVNANSGINPGDELDILDEDNLDDEDDEDDENENLPVMKVLALDGSTQMDLWGGERIFSRKNTVILIRKAKKADKTKDDKDYKSLGRYMFKCIKGLDERPPEYVESPK